MSSLLSRAWGRLNRTLGLRRDQIEVAVQLFGAAYPEATFVQIGANDGQARDPLRIQIERRRWHGVMVEPVPYVFQRLRTRYGKHPRVRLEMSAIADREGVMPFYHLRKAQPGEKVWKYYHALGSFRRDVVLNHRGLVPDIDERLVETEVPCTTFSELCKRHGIAQLDLLQIDTEGYDYEILKTIDFARWRPRLIVYEHYHLSPADRTAARERLGTLGYTTFEHGLDTVALDRSRLTPRDARIAKLFARNDAS